MKKREDQTKGKGKSNQSANPTSGSRGILAGAGKFKRKSDRVGKTTPKGGAFSGEKNWFTVYGLNVKQRYQWGGGTTKGDGLTDETREDSEVQKEKADI